MYASCWIGFILLLVPKFDQNEYRKYRAGCFVFSGLMSSVPAIHALNLDPKYMVDFNEYMWALGGIIYIAGAGLYATKFPEKYYPGKFDLFVRLMIHFMIIFIGVISLIIPYYDCYSSSCALQGFS